MNFVVVLEYLLFGDIRENLWEGCVCKYFGSIIIWKGYRVFLFGLLCNRICLLVLENVFFKEIIELSLYLLICYYFLICLVGELIGEWILLYICIDYIFVFI